MSYGFQSTEQADKYSEYRAMGFEYSLTEPDGTILMERKERGYDHTHTLAIITIDPKGQIDTLYPTPPNPQ